MTNILKRILLGVAALLVPSLLLAQTYTGNAFDQIQIVADDGMIFFGVIIAGAVIVTGFFLGRRWLKRIG